MFSALDILMRQPIKSILAKLPLSEAVKAAILERQGPLGSALSCALAIENAQWSEIDFANLGYDDLSEIYCQAVQWADGMIGRL
jgi:EAL and modified HD-GYP domain-containing signal transduction protein